jgi:ribosomal protein S18 acetylase RimI-like enzyme
MPNSCSTIMLMIILPASEFSLDDLTAAYNQTRTDYLIPMPMNPARMQEYIALYDINLRESCVAISNKSIVGLGMLGLRPGEGWVTRLGVLPDGRRQGVGGTILQALLDHATNLEAPIVWLEVIKGNNPAHELFLKCGFQPVRELIVARRAPKTMRSMSSVLAARKIHYLQHEEVIELHCNRPGRANWLNSVASMRNVRRLAASVIDDKSDPGPLHESAHLSGLWVEFQNGSEGWVTYRATALQLKRIWVEVVRGDAANVTAGLLEIMHLMHGAQDAIVENIAEDDQWAGFMQAGYFEVFRRIEMVLE